MSKTNIRQVVDGTLTGRETTEMEAKAVVDTAKMDEMLDVLESGKCSLAEHIFRGYPTEKPRRKQTRYKTPKVIPYSEQLSSADMTYLMFNLVGSNAEAEKVMLNNINMAWVNIHSTEPTTSYLNRVANLQVGRATCSGDFASFMHRVEKVAKGFLRTNQ